MLIGTVTAIKLDKGFGFIRPDGGASDVFFHCRALEGLEFDERLEERRVAFTVQDNGGRQRAALVKPAEG